MTPSRRLAAEALGTFSLLATVIGSGIMAERLADGNLALALLGNTIPTGAILVVLNEKARGIVLHMRPDLWRNFGCFCRAYDV